MQRRFTPGQIALLSILATLIVVVIAVGAILIVRNVVDANKETEKMMSGSSSGSSSSVSDTTAPGGSGSKSGKKTKSSTTSANPSYSSGDNTKSSSTVSSKTSSKTSSKVKTKKVPKKTSSKTSSKSKVKGEKVKRVTPKKNTSHVSTKTLKVNGKTCYEGDTITVVLNLSSQKSVVNYQGTLKFDKNYLELKEAKSNNIGIANAAESEVMYNASTISGMNFSETGTICSVTFKVLKTGSTKITNNLEIISELANNNIKQLDESDYKTSIDIYG